MAKRRKGNPVELTILIPISEEQFFEELRTIVREEMQAWLETVEKGGISASKINGMASKPLYDMAGICNLFDGVSRSTIYEWIRVGLLKPRKLRGKVYFMTTDIERLLETRLS